ncbi:hypothetical protein SADUNF_Sadunf06G0112600 [Salix dunnii]|uniref:Uncharacterized protein n=1 Tax=Salix dunnii TaxID=1413687 RepID=A0A835JZI4_9ROSI|nr:hypothetical protein SADUNF_Sadunf06G0112600 [Salix dunnii]
MEGLLKHVRKDTKPGASLSDNSYNLSEKVGLTAALSHPDQSRVLITRPPRLCDSSSNCRQMVSLWTCSKMCAIFFVAGIVVGYTLKKRVRRWAAKLLRRLKDD